MTREEYVAIQKENVAIALKVGQKALTAARVYVDDGPDQDAKTEFAEDTLMFFDMASALNRREHLQRMIKDFKYKMIQIKLENDTLLLEGAFDSKIDHDIAMYFLDNNFCQVDVDDVKTVDLLEKGMAILKEIDASL